MKEFFIDAGKVLLRFIYFFMKLLPQKNRIVMLSRESDSIPLDFELLEKELNDRLPQYKVVMLCELLSSKEGSPVRVVLNTLKSMFLISQSRVCIIDTYCLAVSVLKHRKNLKVIQIWHAPGGLKKSGYVSLDKSGGHSSKTAKALCMHKNYDCVISCSDYCSSVYKEAFNCDESIIFKLGMPRIDYILSNSEKKQEKLNEIIKKYPEISNGKINILYAPTFREGKVADTKEILRTVDFSKYNLLMKIHDVEKKHNLPSNVIAVTERLVDLFGVCEYVITDYSATSIEAAVAGKKLFFYVYDIDNYMNERGLFINPLEEYPSISSVTFNDIYKKIEKCEYDESALESFRRRTVETADTENSARIAEKICEELEK